MYLVLVGMLYVPVVDDTVMANIYGAVIQTVKSIKVSLVQVR